MQGHFSGVNLETVDRRNTSSSPTKQGNITMSKLAQYALIEQQMKQLQQQMLELENDENLKQEIEFKEKLEALMRENNKSAREVIEIVAPERAFAEQQAQKKTTRKPRKLKIYKNPMTGEVVETRGGNHAVLKQWKDEHGADTVEGWLVVDDADNQPSEEAKEEPKAETKEEPKAEETKAEKPKKGGKEKEETAT